MEISGMCWVSVEVHYDGLVDAIGQNMSSKVTVETLPILPGSGGSNDVWKDFSFVYDYWMSLSHLH